MNGPLWPGTGAGSYPYFSLLLFIATSSIVEKKLHFISESRFIISILRPKRHGVLFVDLKI